MSLTQLKIDEHNRLYQRGLGLIRQEIVVEGEDRSSRPGWLARWRLRRGIAFLRRALRIHPSWQNHFWIGKALQRLGDWRGAMSWFSDAHRIDPSQGAVAKEGANVAMELGEYDFAIALLRPAIKASSDDAALRHNLGLVYLLSGRPNDARDILQIALALQPEKTTASLLLITEGVIAGVRPRPINLREVEAMLG
jgi:tetratricopeptide (TPR) repeat protein